VDLYGVQRLTYSQFTAANIVAENLATDEILGVVFKLLDIDRDGIVKKEDLSEFVKSEFRNIMETKYGAELAAEAKVHKDLDLPSVAALAKSS
jgi:Ca2+-binding EF-hand superfamily protein